MDREAQRRAPAVETVMIKRQAGFKVESLDCHRLQQENDFVYPVKY